jgi:glutamyl-tRNA synthetase
MIDTIIRKHVLKNIHDYGKANPGSIIGKVIGEYPDAKNDVKAAMKKINAEISRASKLGPEELEAEMSGFEYAVKEEKEKTISIPNAEKGKVVTRFPPEPSGYPHIGHAKAAWLDFESARVNEGYMVLRFDDTNPEKESEEFVGALEEGLKWLGVEWGKKTFTSDHMAQIYDAAETLIRNGRAYVCTAPQEEIREARTSGKATADRGLSNEENLARWNAMLEGKYGPGEAILLFKGDLSADNTTLRDPALARIITTHHFRQHSKYVVWPGYDLAVVVMDHLEGITHSMRSKEYELRDALYREICEALGWEVPELVGFARLAIKNAPISKRLITPLVKENKVLGWDDPRLPTLAGLKRRGMLPEAIKQFVLYFGLSKTESEPDWEVLLAFNRKLLDPEAPHYFFVPEPVLLEVEGLDDEVELKLHPRKDLGARKLKAKEKVYIPKDDADHISEGEIFRLKDLCNVRLIRKGKALAGELAGEQELSKRKIQWAGETAECSVLVPKDLLKDGEFDPSSLVMVKGVCEKSVEMLKEGDIVQFERFGFCRLDRKKPLTFVFSC